MAESGGIETKTCPERDQINPGLCYQLEETEVYVMLNFGWLAQENLKHYLIGNYL